MTTARVDPRERRSRLLVRAIGLAVALLALGVGGLLWSSHARDNPEYWNEREMFEHLRAKGLDPSYQLCEGTLGYYLVMPKPGQNAAALVAAWETMASPRPSEVTAMWRDTGSGRSTSRTSSRIITFRGWVFMGSDPEAVSEIRSCLEK